MVISAMKATMCLSGISNLVKNQVHVPKAHAAAHVGDGPSRGHFKVHHPLIITAFLHPCQGL